MVARTCSMLQKAAGTHPQRLTRRVATPQPRLNSTSYHPSTFSGKCFQNVFRKAEPFGMRACWGEQGGPSQSDGEEEHALTRYDDACGRLFNDTLCSGLRRIDAPDQKRDSSVSAAGESSSRVPPATPGGDSDGWTLFGHEHSAALYGSCPEPKSPTQRAF